MEKKTWIDYRVEEMEEKSGLGSNPFPEYDMDGSRFQPEEWSLEMEDAYTESISYRMGWLMGIVHPDELPKRMRDRIGRKILRTALDRVPREERKVA